MHFFLVHQCLQEDFLNYHNLDHHQNHHLMQILHYHYYYLALHLMEDLHHHYYYFDLHYFHYYFVHYYHLNFVHYYHLNFDYVVGILYRHLIIFINIDICSKLLNKHYKLYLDHHYYYLNLNCFSFDFSVCLYRHHDV